MEQTFGSAERVTEKQGQLLGRARDADERTEFSFSASVARAHYSLRHELYITLTSRCVGKCDHVDKRTRKKIP